MFHITTAEDSLAWDSFLASQVFSPFLQSWTMGEVYREIGQEPVRLEIREAGKIVGLCAGHVVRARRGSHIAVPYGPVFAKELSQVALQEAWEVLRDALKSLARASGCTFIRISPFDPAVGRVLTNTVASPMHMLAEHVWYLPLVAPDPWAESLPAPISPLSASHPLSAQELLSNMRSTTRNLIRRAEKEGVTVTASKYPQEDLKHFLQLHDETRKRHKFVPYTDAFFRAQIEKFSARNEATLYLAHWNGTVIASSIHMHAFGETSYHHGASSHEHAKIPASYLVQWHAIQDALARGDHVYNFWGIAPPDTPKHPFAGVTLFKTGFGGTLLSLPHCADLPISPLYRLTRAFELVRKWKRGF